MGDAGPETQSLPSRIATLVHSHFDGLPKRSKPVIRDDGTVEWVPMTGIVIVKGELLSLFGVYCYTVYVGNQHTPISPHPSTAQASIFHAPNF
jgi:tRNA-specific adenosine deaminase 1